MPTVLLISLGFAVAVAVVLASAWIGTREFRGLIADGFGD